MMQDIACKVESMIPDGYGFGIVVFKFSDEPGMGQLHWVSNSRREDMVLALQEFIRREGN